MYCTTRVGQPERQLIAALSRRRLRNASSLLAIKKDGIRLTIYTRSGGLFFLGGTLGGWLALEGSVGMRTNHASRDVLWFSP